MDRPDMSGQTIEAGDAENLQLSFDQEMLHTPEEASPTIPKEKTKNILWVDDSPDKNAFILKSLKELNFDVTTTTTTLAGVASFNERSYGLVISDMGRMEEQTFHAKAGIDLVKQIRKIDPAVAIALYCSPREKEVHESAALDAGANIVTASPTQLLAFIYQLNS